MLESSESLVSYLQVSYTAPRTPWLNPGSGPNWAASEATAPPTPTKSLTWTWAAHWASTHSLTTWWASSAATWAWPQPSKSWRRACPPARRQPSWPWSSSRIGPRWAVIPARQPVEACLYWCRRQFSDLLQLRLEALHQIVVLISGMEEKGSQPCSTERSGSSFHSSSLLTSVRLQFLAGCFGLGTVGTGGLKRESVQLHHYQVLPHSLQP